MLVAFSRQVGDTQPRRWWALVALLFLSLVPTAVHAEPGAPAEPKEALPWETTRRPPKLPGRQFRNAKEYLELLGVDASQWNNLFHDQPLGEADEEWIDRILFYLPRIGAENLFRWRRTDWSFSEVTGDPASHQGSVLHVKGRATAIEKISLLPEVADRYEFDHYYRVRIALGEDHAAIICTRTIPEAWLKLETLDEPVQVDGIFLKTSPADDRMELVLAARRVAWLPDKASSAAGTSADSLFLARQGVDHGLWDQVRDRQMRPLQDPDREPFYELLAALRDVPLSKPELSQAPPVDIARALNEPAQQMGSLVSVAGDVRRIEKVEVNDSDIRTRYGIDHYYTLYVFVPLHHQKIKWARSRDDKQPRVFENHFPVTVCVAELPPGLTPGPNVHERVELSGTYFKVWTYKPQGGGQDLPQPSPLIIAPTAVMVPSTIQIDSTTNTILGVLFVLLLGVTWVVVWRFNRHDERFKREVLAKKVLKEDQVDLTKLE
jgi:hypothetical protein